MSTIKHHVVIVGDEATTDIRKQVAEALAPQLPNGGATSRGFFEKSSDLVKTMMSAPNNAPVFIVTIQTPASFVTSQQQQTSNSLLNAHSFRYWWAPETCGTTVEEAVQVILSALKDNCTRLRPSFLASRGGLTRGKKEVSFLTAIREGLAPDGGLYTPKQLPTIPKSQLDAIFQIGATTTRYADLALAVLEQLVDVFEVPPGILKEMVDRAYNPELWASAANTTLPVTKVDNLLPGGASSTYIAELYHGPTAAFKDFALQLFPQLFAQSILGVDDEQQETENKLEEQENNSNKKPHSYMILAATSGDTGVSAIRGFMNGAPHVKVMILYPKNGVSPVQRQQMLSFHGGNVRVVGVDADFDFCQTTVKTIFNDQATNSKLESECNTSLSSANSINWGRLLPQVVYYFWIYSQVLKQQQQKSSSNPSSANINNFIQCVVPTGNFGNILSGYFAKQLGVPIGRFVLASNTNDVLCDFIKTGTYDISGRSLRVTASPSIDILKASNVERFLYYLSNYDSTLVANMMKSLDTDKKFVVPAELVAKMQKDFVSFKCSENECAAEIQQLAKDDSKNNIMIDPHTAVAVHAAKLYSADLKNDVPIVVVSTAHWAKFPDCVNQAIDSATFPDPAETNQLPAEKVVDIFNSVTSKVKGSFVAVPLKKTFDNIGKAEVLTSNRSMEEIIGMVVKFAKE